MAGDRKCANCGAPVGVLVDVCPSCGADPDLQLLDLGVGRSRRRDRPDAGGPRRPGVGWKRWTPIVALVVVVWGFLVLTAGGDDDDGQAAAPGEEQTPKTEARPEGTRRTGTTRPRRTTTTTTPLAEQAPLLGEPSGLTLLLQGDGDIQLLDLDSGVLRRASSRAGPIGAAGGRLLVLSDSGQVAWWPSPYDGTGAELLAAASLNNGVWFDPASDTIWILIADPDTYRMTLRALSFDGELRYERELDGDAWPAGAMGDDLLVAAPGGSFVLSPDGDVRLLSVGDAYTTTDGRALIGRCDESLECFSEVLEADGDVVATFPLTSNGFYRGPSFAGSPLSKNLDLAEMVSESDGIELRINGEPVPEPDGVRYNGGGLGWSPDGRWLFVAADRGALVAIDAETLTPRLVLEGRFGDQFYSVLPVEGISLQP